MNDGRFQSIVRDISKRMKAQEKLKWFEFAIAQSPGSIFITDCNGIIEYVNQKFSELTGYSQQELIGKNPRIIKSGKTPVETYRQMWETIINGKVSCGELINVKRVERISWKISPYLPFTITKEN